jgi:hypothetical protein
MKTGIGTFFLLLLLTACSGGGGGDSDRVSKRGLIEEISAPVKWTRSLEPILHE